MTFLTPMYLALLLLLAPVLAVWWWRQRTLPHSQVRMHANLRNLSVMAHLPTIAFSLAFVSLILALAQPAIPHSSEKQTIETRDIFVAVDISGSMSDPISASGGATPGWCAQYGCQSAAGQSSTKVDPYSPTLQPNKQDLARHAVEEFVQLRKGDRIALAEFDDSVYYSWPFSTDTDVLEQKAATITYIGGGTNFDGPSGSSTSMGPLQAAVNMFLKYGQSKTKVLVFVTDGGSSIDPQRMAQLTKAYEQQGVHVYVLGVGDDWTTNSSDTQDLRNFVTQLHGRIINAGSAKELQAGIETINSLERSQVSTEREVAYHDMYPPFVLAALLFFVLFLVLNAMTRRTS